jgi:hypothetical protein
MRSMNEPGSYSEYISSDRNVVSLRHFLNRHLSSSGAFFPVKKSQASALACEAAPPAAGVDYWDEFRRVAFVALETIRIPGVALVTERLRRDPPQRRLPAADRCTCATTQRTRRSIAATTRTCPRA